MVEVVLNSGTTWVVPLDWDSSNNSVQCFGGGAAGSSVSNSKNTEGRSGGGAGAYARGDNILLTPGATIQVRIGAGGTTGVGLGNPGGDTCFNATSLANAVTNGDTVSVAAQGGQVGANTSTGGAGGVGTNGVGNHTRTSGGAGGNGSAGNSGAGGSCPNGGAGGAAITTTATPGNPGTIPGGGGSGAKGSGTHAGGVGAQGRIIINYEPLANKDKMFLVF